MKKIFMMTFSALVCLTACAEDGVKFKIKGTLPDTVKTVVVIENGNEKSPVATGEVKNGQFTIEGSAQKDAILGIGYKEQRRLRYVSALNDGEPIEIRLVDDMMVKGSKLNNEFGEMQANSDVMVKGKDLIQQWQTLRNDTTEAGKAKAAELMNKANALMEEADNIKLAYIKAHKDDVTPAMLMSGMYYQFEYQELVDFLNSGAAWVNHPMIAPVKKQVEAMGKRQPGRMFTDLEMNDTEGKLAKLSDWVGKGNYVLVDFWASWCGPCRREMPHVVKAYQTYKAKGFDVVGVSFDQKDDAWKKAIADLGLEWHNISDLKGWQCAASAAYGINSIPSNILVGPDGKIVASDLRGEALLNKLEEIYK
ncbi:MAG: redoxin domain-containing protein [Prevotella sp.]